MANSGAAAGLYYGVEKYYNPSVGWRGNVGQGVSSTLGFCIGAKLTSMERNNNIEVIYGLGQSEPIVLVEKQFAGSFSVEGLLSDPWFLIPLFGVYNPTAKTMYAVSGAMGSLTVVNSIINNRGATPVIHTFQLIGCVMTNCSISSAVNEIATCKMDYAYMNEGYNSITPYSQGAASSVSMPYTFAAGNLYWNGSSQPLAQVQSVELTINPNRDLIYGLGQRTAVNAVGKNIEYDINLSLVFEDPADMLRYFYTGQASGTTPVRGGAAGCLIESTLTLTFVNCFGGNSITFSLTGIKINTDSLPQNPTEMIVENVNMKAKTCVATVVSATANPPLP